MNIVKYLELNTSLHPDKWTLTHSDRTYTYYEFNMKVNLMANGHKNLEIQNGEKVAFMQAPLEAEICCPALEPFIPKVASKGQLPPYNQLSIGLI